MINICVHGFTLYKTLNKQAVYGSTSETFCENSSSLLNTHVPMQNVNYEVLMLNSWVLHISNMLDFFINNPAPGGVVNSGQYCSCTAVIS